MDTIYLYQAALLEAYIDPDHHNALEDVGRDLRHDTAAPDALLLTPLAEVSITVTLSEIIAAQKRTTYDRPSFLRFARLRYSSLRGRILYLATSIPKSLRLNRISSLETL